MSCSVAGSTGMAKMAVYDGYYSKQTDIEGKGIYNLQYTMPDDATKIFFEIYLQDSNSSVELEAAKIEIGAVSTLHLDLMQPPNYAEQLRKCQRYFYAINEEKNPYAIFGNGTAYATETAFVPITTAIIANLRVFPTVLSQGEIVLLNKQTAEILNVTDISAERLSTKGIIEIKVAANGVTAGQDYLLTTNGDANARIFFSAEL